MAERFDAELDMHENKGLLREYFGNNITEKPLLIFDVLSYMLVHHKKDEMMSEEFRKTFDTEIVKNGSKRKRKKRNLSSSIGPLQQKWNGHVQQKKIEEDRDLESLKSVSEGIRIFERKQNISTTREEKEVKNLPVLELQERKRLEVAKDTTAERIKSSERDLIELTGIVPTRRDEFKKLGNNTSENKGLQSANGKYERKAKIKNISVQKNLITKEKEVLIVPNNNLLLRNGDNQNILNEKPVKGNLCNGDTHIENGNSKLDLKYASVKEILEETDVRNCLKIENNNHKTEDSTFLHQNATDVEEQEVKILPKEKNVFIASRCSQNDTAEKHIDPTHAPVHDKPMGQEDAENANITVTDESTKHSEEQSVQDVHQQLKPHVLEPSQEGIFTKPRDTIDVDGPYYEVKFALMLFVRGICKLYGIEKFKLAANVGETNPFDDAVFQCFFRTPDETLKSRTYFIQLKHKKYKNNLLVSFKDPKFFPKDLPKLLKGIPALKDKILKNSFPTFKSNLEDCEFIFYTNSGIDEEVEGTFCICRHILSSNKAGDYHDCKCDKNYTHSKAEVLNHGIFTFNLENEILKGKLNCDLNAKVLKIFAYQSSEQELDNIIQSDLKDALQKSSEECKAIYYKLFDVIINWWRKDTRPVLTDESDILERIINSEYLSKLKRDAKHSISVTNTVFTDDHIDFVENVISKERIILVLATNTFWSKSKIFQCLEHYHSDDFFPATLSQFFEERDSLLDAWKTTNIFLLESDDISEVKKQEFSDVTWNVIQKNNEKEMKLIIVLQESDPLRDFIKLKFTNCYEYVDNTTFDHLHEDFKYVVLEKTVNFQGYNVQLKMLGDVVHFLSEDILSNVLKREDITIGSSMGNADPHYISRELGRKTNIRQDILDVSKYSARFVFSGMKKEEFQRFRNQPGEEIWESSQLIAPNTNCRYFLLSEENSEQEFKELCNVYDEDIHYFEVDRKSLVWKKSHKNCKRSEIESSCMKVLREHNSADCELSICMDSEVVDSVVPIIAEAGMGKTAMLKHNARIIKEKSPSSLVIYINLNENTNYLNQKSEVSIIDLCISSNTENAQITQFERHLISHILTNTKNAVVFIDEFDEVFSRYKEKITALLCTLVKLQLKQIWVASRQTFQIELEDILCSLSFNIIPLNRNEQEQFLMEYLKRDNVSETDVQNVTSTHYQLAKNYLDDMREFLGNPLHLQMFAELLLDNCINTQEGITCIKLYEKYVDFKIDCFREKAGLNETKPTTSIIQSELKEVFLKRLEKLALFATLEDEAVYAKETSEENMVKNFQSVEMLGIVVELKDGKPRFINKKLAVYFAANWLSRHYKDKRDFLSGKFFEDNYKDLRKLFDLILAGSHDYHCSIVDDREVQEQGLSEISISPDRGERIPLHLAASYNNIKYAEKLLKVGNRSKQVKYRDSVLNWTPLQYALKTRSLGTLNHLMNVQKGEIVDNDCNILIEAIKENCLNLTANMMLHKDICEFKDESGNTPLHLAVWYGDISMVKQMVKTYKKKEGSGILSFNNKVPYVMNAPNKDENTPLHIAVIQGKSEVMNHLMEKGSDPHLTNKQGNNILHIAVWTEDNNIVKKLVGNKKLNLINVKNSDGNTPLILGVKVKNNEIVQELVENGADTSIKNNDGESALLLSVLSNSSEVVDVLLNFINKNAKSLEDINNSAHLAAEMGSKKILEKLTRSGAVLDAQNYAGDTKLHVAASHGEMEVVKLLVESGADLKLLNNKGNTPLQEAVEQNKIEVAKYLHENFPDRNFLYQAIVNGRKKMVDFLVNVGVNINSCNESGDLPLHVAIKNQRKDMAAYLIERGADLRAKDVNEDTALHVALSQGDIEMVQCVVNASNVNEPNAKGDSPLHLAVNKNRKDFVNCLIANDGDSSKQNLEGNSPIHEAVRKGLTEMVQHLITKGVNLNIRNKNGMTPLHVAVKEGRTEEAVLLLKNGANFKIRNLKGNSPLHEALHLNNFELTKELILNGVDIDTKNHDGNTALHELAKMGGESELELAELLFQRGAQLTLLNNNGNTPIIRAASRGREDFIKFFVDHGVDINEGPLGVTPLYVAVASGQFNVVKSLLEEYKADIEVCEEKTKQTPVHIAVRKNQLGILKYLVQRGARTDVYNRHSKTPLMLACELGYKDIENYLQNVKNGNDGARIT